MILLASAGPSPLWYLTRGTGLVSLVLLSAIVALGVVTHSGWQRPAWPRFATLGLHRNLSLLAVVFLAIHIITAELDTFAPVGWLAVLVPFASAYRPIWLGLGTLAFDLLLALTITSLLRVRLGLRAWRAVHWLAYLCWPVAVVHGLGTGTDPRLGWVQLLYAACVAAVAAAAGWRLVMAVGQPGRRLAGAAGVALALIGVTAWAFSGPLSPGWSKRAGTPTRLVATARPSEPVATGSQPGPPAPAAGGGAGLPALPFDATLAGSIAQQGPDPSGQVLISIRASVSGPMSGSLLVELRGQASGGGVSLASSSVTFGPTGDPGAYRGSVVQLLGDQLLATVADPAGGQIQLGLSLQIDPSTASVQGTMQVSTVGAEGSG